MQPVETRSSYHKGFPLDDLTQPTVTAENKACYTTAESNSQYYQETVSSGITTFIMSNVATILDGSLTRTFTTEQSTH